MKKETRESWMLFIGIVFAVTLFIWPLYKHQLNKKDDKLKIATHKIKETKTSLANNESERKELMSSIIKSKKEIAELEQGVIVITQKLIKEMGEK